MLPKITDFIVALSVILTLTEVLRRPNDARCALGWALAAGVLSGLLSEGP